MKRGRREGFSLNHSSDCEIWAGAIIPAVLEHVCQCPDASRYKTTRLKFSEILWMPISKNLKMHEVI